MDWIWSLVEPFLHLDEHLQVLIEQYGVWVYAIVFVIIFCETGLVVTPFLPGDSLLFAVGTFAASGSLDLLALIGLLIVAAVLGDTVNYSCGAALGPRVFRAEDHWFFRKEHLLRTQRFYERHGGKTIVLARFLPIVRTFAPFVAGVGQMRYRRFLGYNIAGGIIWVLVFVLSGYAFGNVPIVRENFELVAVGIVAVSLLPLGFEWLRTRAEARRCQKSSG
jgi:membrane-associated protein